MLRWNLPAQIESIALTTSRFAQRKCRLLQASLLGFEADYLSRNTHDSYLNPSIEHQIRRRSMFQLNSYITEFAPAGEGHQ